MTFVFIYLLKFVKEFISTNFEQLLEYYWDVLQVTPAPVLSATTSWEAARNSLLQKAH